jgi:AraC-like DNA-binding protein
MKHGLPGGTAENLTPPISFWDMVAERRGARLARPCRAPSGLGLVLDELGVPARERLRSAGLNPQTLREPRPWLSIDDYFALWEAIGVGPDAATLGVRLGARYPEHVLEPAFLACLGSRNLGEALRRLSRYKHALCPERLTLRRCGGWVEIHYEWPTAPTAPPPILVAAELSFLLHLARKASRQEMRDARVGLTYPLGDPSPYESVLRAEVWLGAQVGTLNLLATYLDLPFATFNPSLLADLEPALLSEQSVGVSALADTVASVRQVLRRRLGDGEISLRQVANELGMSTRTLQRQLRAAGTSFAGLLNDIRRGRAMYYLEHSELSSSEIAFLLGFDSPSAFFRAFARWTGQTPGTFRDRPANR